VIRSLRATALLATLFVSYGWQWLLVRLLGDWAQARWERVHRRNARRLASGFTRLRGVYIKLGQVLSVLGTFLPKAYGEELEGLQDSVPAHPFNEIEAHLKHALGPDALSRFSSFDPTPVAAASLAQVHRAQTTNGEWVAVKVLYPGIQQVVASDLRLLRRLLPFARVFILMAKFERVLDQLGAMLGRELDYQHEQHNMERIRTILGNRPDVIIPRPIVELCGTGVLTMSFETGTKINDLATLDRRGISAEASARILVSCYLEMLLEHRVFHADPHPGNFLIQEGPKLVILDFGAVEEVTVPLAEGMKRVVIGGLTRNPELVLAGMEQMGFVAEGGDRALLQRVGHEYLQALAAVKIKNFADIKRDEVAHLSGFLQLRGRMREVMRSVEYPEGYFYVERTVALLFGLVGQLAPAAGLPGIAAPLASRALLKELARPLTQ
jgi:predicted unusual protein kinase regulating ubiquinone biosynthesis (AarF/ABC1/UbiB family)